MNDFNTFPDNSKVWVYQSSKKLTEDEVDYICVALDNFISSWESHGKLLKASFEVFHQAFIVLCVDEEGDNMCGRALDSSLQLIKELENQLEISLLDRMIQAYKKDNKVIITTMQDFSNLIAKKEINENTIVFNNTITTKVAFDTKWEVPLKDSWHKQLLLVTS